MGAEEEVQMLILNELGLVLVCHGTGQGSEGM